MIKNISAWKISSLNEYSVQIRLGSNLGGFFACAMSHEKPDEMEYSLATLMMNIVNDEKLNIEKAILHHKEGVDLIPANIELSDIEVSLVNAMSRELILKSMVEKLRDFYDFIIIECMSSLGMMTINACSVSHPLG